MKKSATLLVLLALLALIPCTRAMAQTQPVPSVASAVPDTAEFLASLSTVATPAAGDLAPAPSFMTGCTSNAQCPRGTLCCYPCGIDGCTNQCLTPIKGRCPLFQ